MKFTLQCQSAAKGTSPLSDFIPLDVTRTLRAVLALQEVSWSQNQLAVHQEHIGTDPT